MLQVCMAATEEMASRLLFPALLRRMAVVVVAVFIAQRPAPTEAPAAQAAAAMPGRQILTETGAAAQQTLVEAAVVHLVKPAQT